MKAKTPKRALSAAILLIGLLVNPAPARGDAVINACRVATVDTPNFRVQKGPTPNENVYYYATNNRTIPSSSTCNDINVSILLTYATPNTATCAYIRYRLYPSSGGELVGTWIWHCSSNTLHVIGSGILNGTVYRLELTDTSLVAPQRYWVKITD